MTKGETRSIAIDVQRLTECDTVVHVVGDVVGDAAAAMQQTLTEQLLRGPTRLIVNVSAVSRIDADGVEVLALVAAIAGEADYAFCLVDNEAGPVHAALDEAHMTDRFEMFWSIIEALRNSS